MTSGQVASVAIGISCRNKACRIAVILALFEEAVVEILRLSSLLNPAYLSPGVKTKVKTLFTLTGEPSKVAGLKTHLRAASTAAPRSA
jgi:hypothetical protein